jgi:hypothetical protein
MRNEFTTSGLCSAKRLYKQSRSHREPSKRDGRSSASVQKTMDATKNSPEPLRLRCASCCASGGMTCVLINRNTTGLFLKRTTIRPLL